jgi:hypothetical protein
MMNDGRISNKAQLAQSTGGIAKTGLAETATFPARAAATRLGIELLKRAVVAGYGTKTVFPGAALTVFLWLRHHMNTFLK